MTIIFWGILKCRVYFLDISHLLYSSFSHLSDFKFSHFCILHFNIFTSLHFHIKSKVEKSILMGPLSHNMPLNKSVMFLSVDLCTEYRTLLFEENWNFSVIAVFFIFTDALKVCFVCSPGNSFDCTLLVEFSTCKYNQAGYCLHLFQT